MNTVVLEVRSLAEALADASHAMKGRTPNGKVEFPFETVRVEFVLKAA